MSDKKYVDLIAVGIISFTAIIYQVCLTLILAVTLWYHFASLVISAAMLGLTAAALTYFKFWPGLIERNTARYVKVSCICFALTAPLALWIHLNLNFENITFHSMQLYLILVIQIIFFVMTFFWNGLALNILLFRKQQRFGIVYFFDLTGAALASLLIIPVLYWISPMSVVFVLSALATLVAFFYASKYKERTILLFFVLLFLLAGYKNDSWNILAIKSVKNYLPDNAVQAKKKKGRIFEKWSPFGWTTAYSSQNIQSGSPRFISVFTNEGAPTNLHQYENTTPKSSLSKIIFNVQVLPFWLKQNADVLIIGSGGGRSVLTGILSGQKNITALEINPITADLVTKYFANYIGHIFSYPQVQFLIADGRNFIAESKKTYDIIEIGMVDTWGNQTVANNSYIFSENTLYTKEAFGHYIHHLNPNGILSITRYYGYDEGLRLLNTLIEVLEELKVDAIKDHIIIIYQSGRKGPFELVNILFKKNKFLREDSLKIRDLVHQNGQEIIYDPLSDIRDMKPSAGANTYRNLILSGEDRRKIIANHPANISATTDNQPFFFYMKRFKDSFNIDPFDHPARRLAIPFLYTTFLIMLSMSILTLTLSLCFHRKENPSSPILYGPMFLYFALIGLGYMLIELSLIQRLTVFLGHPIYALMAVLGGLLFSSGLGSYLSEFIKNTRRLPILKTILIVIMLWGIMISGVIFNWLSNLMVLSHVYRVLFSLAFIAPLGLFMGMCFPLGISLIWKDYPRGVAWAWGINGIFAVLGSILAMVIALNWGLNIVFFSGTLCYLAAWIVLTQSLKPPGRSQNQIRGMQENNVSI